MTEPQRGDVGAWLRECRLQAGRSLRQIADTTKLPVRTLEALERNKVSQLPGGIYGRSIVRAYAREIGLDPEFALRRFLAEHPPDPDTMPLPTTAVIPQSSAQQALRTVLAAIGALIAPAVSSNTREPRLASASRGTPVNPG
jgi:cytoskeletal protein RodZ